MKLATALVVALLAPTMAGAQQADLAGLLSGKNTPQSMQLKQLDSTWLRIAIRSGGTTEAGPGDMLGKLAQIGMMADGGKKAEGLPALLGLLGGLFGDKGTVYFTKGTTIALGAETFLIAYAVEKAAPNLVQMIMEAKEGGKEPDPSALFSSGKWTEDTVATLALVNVRTIGSLTGVRPFDLKTEIAESEKGGMGLMDLLLLGEAREVPAPKAQPAVKQQQAPAQTTKPKR